MALLTWKDSRLNAHVCLLPVLFAVASGCAGSAETRATAHWENVREARTRATESSATLTTTPELEDVLQSTEARNPSLESAFDQWTANLEGVGVAKALPNPKLGYAYFLESVETRVGPQRQKFSLSQSFPLFGKRSLRGSMASSVAEESGAKYEAERRKLLYDTTRLWLEFFYLQRSLQTVEDNTTYMRSLAEVVQRRYETGAAQHSSLIQTQLELATLKDRLARLTQEQQPIAAALNAKLDRPADAPIGLPDTLPKALQTIPAAAVPGSTTPTFEALLDRHPKIQAAEARRERARAASTLAEKMSFPDLTLGFEYIETADSEMPGVADRGKDAAVAVAMIDLPLWFDRNDADRGRAHARLSGAESDLVETRNELRAELERVLFELSDADRRMQLYNDDLLPLARQSLEVVTQQFAAGSSSFTDVIQEQRRLLDLELSLDRARVDLGLAIARWNQLIGDPTSNLPSAAARTSEGATNDNERREGESR